VNLSRYLPDCRRFAELSAPFHLSGERTLEQVVSHITTGKLAELAVYEWFQSHLLPDSLQIVHWDPFRLVKPGSMQCDMLLESSTQRKYTIEIKSTTNTEWITVPSQLHSNFIVGVHLDPDLNSRLLGWETKQLIYRSRTGKRRSRWCVFEDFNSNFSQMFSLCD
jgi:hypothetical protein